MRRLARADLYLPRGLALRTKRKRRVVIASVPRCGSTLLFRAVSKNAPGGTFPRSDRRCAFVADLRSQELSQEKSFFKTHSLAPQWLPEDVCAVFIFGDPVAAVWSTWKKRFNRQHFSFCGWNEEVCPDILNRDDLGYEMIFDDWMRRLPFEHICVRYEALWSRKKVIEDFLGRPITLPPFQARNAQIPPDIESKLHRVYDSLVRKCNAAPDVAIWPAGDGSTAG